jgi:rfaE bifunctional protein nucleotidyltransferase chain/domain
MLQIKSLISYSSPKIISFSKAITIIEKLKINKKKIGLCHGGFDMLHPGHVKHFESAKKLCDVLFVSVSSDRYVSIRKGDGRPIFPEKLRVYMISCLEMVDYVFISDYQKGVDVINALKPSFYIKGPDFIGKQTPGIISEREAINKVGGQMLYTNDPKLSTTEIIQYIRNINAKQILLIIDRDGTLTTSNDYFGKGDNWKNELRLNLEVVNYVSFLQTKYRTTSIVVSNQSGVARGYFDKERVEEVNNKIQGELRILGVRIDSWQFCPDVDENFVQANPDVKFIKKYIRKITKRKPSIQMVTDSLNQLGKTIKEFTQIIVIGDRQEDSSLANNLNAKFIDIKEKSIDQMKKEFY